MADQLPDNQLDSARLHCPECGYDLTGAVIGSRCPECARPIDATMLHHAQSVNSMAVTVLVLGILSLTCCPLFGLVPLMLYIPTRKQLNTGLYSDSSHSMATAGLVLGIVATALTVGWLALQAWLILQ